MQENTFLKQRKFILFQLLIGTVVIAALVIFVLLFNDVVKVVRTEILEKYNIKQQELAQTIGNNVSKHVQHLSDDLLLLSSFPGIQYFAPDAMQNNINLFFERHRKYGIKAVVLLDRDNVIVYSTDRQSIGKKCRLIGIANWKGRKMRSGDIFISPVQHGDKMSFPESPDSFFLIATPVFKFSHDGSNERAGNEYRGILCLVLDFNFVLRQYFQEPGLAKTERIWLMDQSGRLLYHSHHPEMEFRSIWSNDASCRPCHRSFHVQSSIIRGELGTDRLHVGNSPEQMIAYYPIAVGDSVWTIVINTPIGIIRNVITNRLRKIWFLLILMIVVTVTGGSALLLFNRRYGMMVERSRNISQQLELERKISQKNKLATIGEMVDSVAHDINNPVSVILSRVDYTLNRLQGKFQDEELIEDLRTIRKQTERIMHITDQLLSFSRKYRYQPVQVHLPELLQNIQAVVNLRRRNKSIRLIYHFPPDLPPLKVDPYQMEEVFVNLIGNAIDAIEEEGEITISADACENAQKSPCMKIQIRDNGKGIPEDDMQRIFEPFFTTKAGEQGTGLGLVIVKRIIQKHGGTIKITSKPGTGTTVTILLPLLLSEFTGS